MVEVRQGEWYRVYAPNGQRAWIHSSLVRFGEGSASLNDGSSVRIKGFNADAEQEQFRKLGSITAGE
jgi:SH3-like domain-containing protein